MGYEVHITRKLDWFENEGEVISLDEWTSYIDADASMRLDGFAEAAAPSGEVLRVDAPGLAVWIGYSGHGVGGNMAWFHLNDGSGAVVVKNPDQEILQKMHQIAARLGAKVQGDEGEEYGPTGAVVGTANSDQPSKSPWWRFWR